MAIDAADPREFQKWEDAFQYPVPTVRAMEKKLRTGVVENQDKLRGLVGASYRDLLGTATTIVDISQQMHKVEALLAQSGRKCDSRVLARIEQNCSAMLKAEMGTSRPRLSLASQLQTLQNCLKVVRGQLRADASTLRIAKLLVVARLLQKALAERPDAPPVVEGLGAKLRALRRRLLANVERRLTRLDVELPALVEDLTAFSLATSSTPSSVLVHFHDLRFGMATHSRSDADVDIKKSIVERLTCFLGTLRDSRRIFPDLLSASLRTLGAQALLNDDSIKSLEDLSLELHAKWLTDDVRNYTPWTRHSELSRELASQNIRTWATDTLEAMNSSMKGDVLSITDLRLLVDVRREALQMWLSSRQSERAFDHRLALERLREPFVQRALELVTHSFNTLSNSITTSFEASLNPSTPPAKDTSLWSLTPTSRDLTDGAAPFRKAIVRAHLGRSDAVQALLTAFDAAAQPIQDLPAIIKAMRDTRWEDDFDSDDSDSDDDDDDSANDAQRSTADTLSKTDPSTIDTFARTTALQTLSTLQSTLTTLLATSTPPSTPLTLRMLRDLSHRLPRLLHPFTPHPSPPFSTLISTLHASLATQISTSTTSTLEPLLTHFTTRPLHARALWTGEPSLPCMPSPAAFAYLRSVVRAMEDAGSDLWSAPARDGLKVSLVEGLVGRVEGVARELRGSVEAVAVGEGAGEDADAAEVGRGEEGNETEDAGEGTAGDVVESDGSTEAEPSSLPAREDADARTETSKPSKPSAADLRATGSAAQDKLTQLLFDALYLQQALALPSTAGKPASKDGMELCVERVKAEAGVEGAEAERLRKAAVEYWRRTYLLFGLLAW